MLVRDTSFPLKNYTVYGIQCHLPFGRTFFSNFKKKIIDLIDHIDTREIYKGMKVIALYVDPNEGKKKTKFVSLLV